MQELTIGQVAAGLALCAGIVGSATILFKLGTKWLSKWHTDAVKPVMDKLGEVNKTVSDIAKGLDEVKMENCKNYIVNFLSKIEAGDKMTSDAKARFYENYDLYIRLGGNSYIHEWVERLKSERKL